MCDQVYADGSVKRNNVLVGDSKKGGNNIERTRAKFSDEVESGYAGKLVG